MVLDIIILSIIFGGLIVAEIFASIVWIVKIEALVPATPPGDPVSVFGLPSGRVCLRGMMGIGMRMGI